MSIKSMLICSIAPNSRNYNWRLRDYVSEGFCELLGEHAVTSTTFERSIRLVQDTRPDLVMAFGGVMPDDTDLRLLSRAARSVGSHFAVWLHDDPYELDFCFRVESIADTIFTSDLGSVDYYRHSRVFHLPLAASRTAHAGIVGTQYSQFDLLFCGVAFDNRIRFFADIEKELRNFRVFVLGPGWPSRFAFANDLRVSNSELSNLYRSSSVVLNLGRDFDLGNDRYKLAQSTPGPRTFEAAMAGALQMYFVNGLEICEYFEPEREIILIDDPREVSTRLEGLLADPSRLRSMRIAAHERALRDHTYQSRAQIVLDRCSSD